LNLNELASNNPDYVLISVPADRSFNYAIACARAVKQKLPDTIILMGGRIFGSSVNVGEDCELDKQHDILRQYALDTGWVDSISVGRAEEILPLFLDDIHLGKKIKKIYRKSREKGIARPLRRAEQPARTVAPTIDLGEGCRTSPCDFCSPGYFYRGNQRINPDVLEKDLESLYGEERQFHNVLSASDNPFSRIVLRDEEGNQLPEEEVYEYAQKITDILREYNVHSAMFIDSKVAEDKKLLEILGKQRALSLGFIGIESINPEVLRRMNKQHNEKRYQEYADNLNEARIYSNCTYVFDPEEDSIESAIEAAAKIRDYGFNYATFFVKTPLVGTSFFKDFQGNADDNSESRLLDPVTYRERSNLLNLTYRSEKISMKQAHDMVKTAYKEFYRGYTRRNLGLILRRETHFLRELKQVHPNSVTLLRKIKSIGNKLFYAYASKLGYGQLVAL
jgi:radical SAM superfamily enzyme YgiQ (UPF0313 family)